MTDTNVFAWLEHAAATDPHKPAFADEQYELSYGDLLTQAQAVASALTRVGASHAPVAILLPRGVAQVVSLFGVMAAGSYYAMLDAASPTDRLERIVSEFQPAAILTCTQTHERGEHLLPGRCLDIDDVRRSDIDASLLASIRSTSQASDLLYVLFTSGSTGTPKGVMVSHANVIAYITWFVDCFDINDTTVFGSQTPLYFSMSVSDVFATVAARATLHLIPAQLFAFPAALVRFLNERRITTLYWVPTALSLLRRWDVLSALTLETVRTVLFAGEVMPTPTLNYWMDHLPHARFANLFGPTETTDICAYYCVDHRLRDDEPLPIGFACEGVTLLVLREDGTRAAADEEGELYVGGPFVAQGYLGNPHRTAQAFVPNPITHAHDTRFYRTGDIVRQDETGMLHYIGRRDNQVKRNGYRIELGEIEAAAAACEGVVSCAAVYAHDSDTECLGLFVSGDHLCKERLLTQLTRRLPSYMVPDSIETLPTMPLNSNGKIDRAVLTQKQLSRR